MRWLLLIFLWLAGPLWAQSRVVAPDDVKIEAKLEIAEGVTPYVGEMVLIEIIGTYTRHIALEQLEQPSFEGFSWMQLGEDYWWDTRENGRKVKKLRRRMALFPARAGRLEIAPFRHVLHLIDEGDDWFEHVITSDPLVLEVAPAPEGDDWWFPVRLLEIADNWSNAPDTLKPGEGVMRIIRVEALGVPPEAIPPMPELRSPSGGVFAHPEKRLVDLTPEGPVSVAFWRWTIQPVNGTSVILEPMEVPYFDTKARRFFTARISPTRVAYAEGDAPSPMKPTAPYRLRWGFWLIAALVGLGAGLLLGRRTGRST